MDAARMTDNSVSSIDFDAVDHNMKVVRGMVGPGVAVNVVSMPSWDRFLALPRTERDTILPASVPSIGVEAGSTFGWSMITDHQVGIDRFGASAPGGVVMEKLGVSVANVVATVKAAIAR